MEFLRDEDINKVESLTENSDDKSISGDPVVKFETSEVWPKRRDRNKWLMWFRVIGKKTLPEAQRTQGIEFIT